MYLKRYHDVEISQSGVWRILKRLDMNRLPARNATNRSSDAGNATRNNNPGTASRWTSSSSSPCKAPANLATTSSPRSTTAPDCECCGSTTATTRTPPSNSSTTSARTPVPLDTIQTDNGSEFGSQFHWHVLDRGIRHVYIKPATPRSTAKSNDHTASTPKSSTDSSTATSSTTPSMFNDDSPNGRTTTTTTPTRRPRRPNTLRTTTL